MKKEAKKSLTAEDAGKNSIEMILWALESGRNFKLEAGAGAGKTFSLIESLNYLLERKEVFIPRAGQRIACLTYTKVARDEILSRIDRSPFVLVDTLHGFLWEMVQPFQKNIKEIIRSSVSWAELLDGQSDLSGLKVSYTTGFRNVDESEIYLHHDDIPTIAINLFRERKFRSIIRDRFPILFIDEYQDTPQGLVESILSGSEENSNGPLIGLFGDGWQKIYDNTCGSISHESLVEIGKNSNFRSDYSIVEFLNKLRPALPQAPRENARVGSIVVYHSNRWPGARLTGQNKGQISDAAVQECIEWIMESSPSREVIKSSQDLKILMLTHSKIANKLEYPSLPKVFKYNESFTRKENHVIGYLIDSLEAGLDAYRRRRHGQMFDFIGQARPWIESPQMKRDWVSLLDKLIHTTSHGTVGEVIDILISQDLFDIPPSIIRQDLEVKNFVEDASRDLPRRQEEYLGLRSVKYSEIRALGSYLGNKTSYSTKHSVKGAEFDTVVVVFGRGWNLYNFENMLSEFYKSQELEQASSGSIIRSRNLFYVACSRAKHNLIIFFAHELGESALSALRELVESEKIISINFDSEGSPC